MSTYTEQCAYLRYGVISYLERFHVSTSDLNMLDEKSLERAVREHLYDGPASAKLRHHINKGLVPRDSLGQYPFSPTVRWIHQYTDHPRHPATSKERGDIMVRFIVKLLSCNLNGEIQWWPDWFAFSGNEYYLEESEIKRVALRVHEHHWDAIQCPTEHLFMGDSLKARILSRWAFAKYIELIMRMWFDTYTRDEPCKPRVHGKTRFYAGFVKVNEYRERDDKIKAEHEKLMEIYMGAEQDVKKMRHEMREKKRIDKEKSTKLKKQTKWTLRMGPWLMRYKQEGIDLEMKKLQKKMDKYNKLKSEYIDAEHQRSAFILPEVCKGIWNVYQESEEVHGERIFHRPSGNTVRLVQVLKSVSGTA